MLLLDMLAGYCTSVKHTSAQNRTSSPFYTTKLKYHLVVQEGLIKPKLKSIKALAQSLEAFEVAA